jgi:hypothetical protein
MIHICLDTNIYFRILTQGSPGCEIERFRELREIVEKGKARLVLPEVVELELEGKRSALELELKTKLENYEKNLLKVDLGWNEMGSVKNLLPKFLGDAKQKMIETAERHYKEVTAFLNWDQVTRVPFTLPLWFQAKRRLIEGKMPESKVRAESDCCIIQSLIQYFSRPRDDKPELYFCSENHGDFALELKEKSKASYVLHPAITDLPPSLYFLDLKSLVEAVKEAAPIKPPTLVEIREALEREAQEREALEREEDEHAARMQEYTSRFEDLLRFHLSHFPPAPPPVEAKQTQPDPPQDPPQPKSSSGPAATSQNVSDPPQKKEKGEERKS